jgi:hypothetical protein
MEWEINPLPKSGLYGGRILENDVACAKKGLPLAVRTQKSPAFLRGLFYSLDSIRIDLHHCCHQIGFHRIGFRHHFLLRYRSEDGHLRIHPFEGGLLEDELH